MRHYVSFNISTADKSGFGSVIIDGDLATTTQINTCRQELADHHRVPVEAVTFLWWTPIAD